MNLFFPALISKAVTYSFPFWSYVIIVPSIFPLIPYIKVEYSYSIAIISLYNSLWTFLLGSILILNNYETNLNIKLFKKQNKNSFENQNENDKQLKYYFGRIEWIHSVIFLTARLQSWITYYMFFSRKNKIYKLL